MSNNQRAELIRNEKCPFTREILDFGYDRIVKCNMTRKITLIRGHDGYTKTIDFPRLGEIYTIKTAILYSGERHSWLSESDGSADKFRDIIKA